MSTPKKPTAGGPKLQAQLTMPPAMVLAIRVMQASRRELHEFLRAQCEANPLLQRIAPEVQASPEEVASAPELHATLGPDGFVVSYDDLGLEGLRIDEARADEVGEAELALRYRRDADLLMRAVAARQRHLVRITECIAARQPRWAETGSLRLVAMTVDEVAAATEIHPATVARLVRNKYVKTAHGTFELDSLFGADEPEQEQDAPSAEFREARLDADATPLAQNQRVVDSLERIERWLHAHGAAAIVQNLAPPATQAAIDEIEAELGTSLPPDLRALWSRHGGELGGRSHFFCGLELLAPRATSSWRSFVLALVHNLRRRGAPHVESRVAEEELRSDAWLPVVYASKEEQVVVSCVTGRVFYCDVSPAMRPIAPSVSAWLERYASRLEAGEFSVDEASGACQLRCDGELF